MVGMVGGVLVAAALMDGIGVEGAIGAGVGDEGWSCGGSAMGASAIGTTNGALGAAVLVDGTGTVRSSWAKVLVLGAVGLSGVMGRFSGGVSRGGVMVWGEGDFSLAGTSGCVRNPFAKTMSSSDSASYMFSSIRMRGAVRI